MRVRRSWKNTLMLPSILIFLYALNYLFIANWSTTSGDTPQPHTTTYDCSCAASINSSQSFCHSTHCVIDHGKTVKCLRDADDFFLPFSFLKSHFDVSGKSKDGHLEWQTSYSKIKVPAGKYDTRGSFGHFATYNVQGRERVRCINGLSGVPMSTQWNSIPYYYPIQIAQYGLQFYSRMKEKESVIEESIIVGGETKEWKGTVSSPDGTNERIFFKDDKGNNVVNITTTESLSNPGVYVYLSKDPRLAVLSLSLLPYKDNASFTVLLNVIPLKQVVLLNYISEPDDRCVWAEESNTIKDAQHSYAYSVPWETGKWVKMTRDLLTDASRALSSKSSAYKKAGNVLLHPGDVSLISIGFRGSLAVRQEIKQMGVEEVDEEFFVNTVQWFLDNQDDKGGWSVNVSRVLAEGRLVLQAGWYSAMAQGHALSLLSRSYVHFKEEKYSKAAGKAIQLYYKNSSEGGFRNHFLGVVPWYEEYPSTPGTYVLNGFLYSLIGLYDYASIAEGKEKASALSLWEEGLSSLKRLLPLYDTGTRSTYDLRHIGLNTPPNLARWDYHAVHVYLLKWIFSITKDEAINTVADRWIRYAQGKTAKHN